MNGATAQGQGRIAARPPIRAAHLRTDSWWALPVTVVVVLLSFIVYSTWAAFQNAHYFADPYLSPFYSPCLTKACLHHSFGGWTLPDFTLPIIGVLSPAFLILGGPGLFRLTCYYYRKAYYRSFWLVAAGLRGAGRQVGLHRRDPLPAHPPEPPPLRLVRGGAVHRDADLGRDPRLPVRRTASGSGWAPSCMWINVLFLAGYTFSCHSCRHLCGGGVDVFSKAPVRYALWQRRHPAQRAAHPLFAWLSASSAWR